METERLPQGADPRRHTKLGRGSLSDVEWLVQLMQLKHGKDHPAIRTPKTLIALQACVSEGLLLCRDLTTGHAPDHDGHESGALSVVDDHVRHVASR